MSSYAPLTTPYNLCIEITGSIAPATCLTLAVIKVTITSTLRLMSAAKGYTLSKRTNLL